MNKMLALQISLLVSFANMSAMNKAYSCQGVMKQGKPASTVYVKILGSDTEGEGKGIENIIYDATTKKARITLGSNFQFKSSFDIEGEGLKCLAKTTATSSHVSLETTMPGKEGLRLHQFKAYHAGVLIKCMISVCQDEIKSSLGSANKKLNDVTIESREGSPQKGNIRAWLQVPSVLNPFSSLSIRDENQKNLLIDAALADSLLDFSMLVGKDTPNHNNIVIEYVDDSSSDTTVFLDRKTVTEELQPYFSRLKWRNRGVFGISAAAIFAFIWYLKSKN